MAISSHLQSDWLKNSGVKLSQPKKNRMDSVAALDFFAAADAERRKEEEEVTAPLSILSVEAAISSEPISCANADPISCANAEPIASSTALIMPVLIFQV